MIIITASRKGGSGKSTICCNLAGALALAGLDVVIVDRDPQGTAGNWCHSRGNIESVNPVSFMPGGSGRGFLKTLKNIESKYDVVLVDLQGVDSEDNRYTLTLANKVIFPFKPSQPDLDTLPWIKEIFEQLSVVNTQVEFYCLINESPTATQREKNEALTYFAEYGIKPLDTIVHSRKVYRDSMALGLSVCEMHDEKAKAEIEGVLKEAIGMPLASIRRPLAAQTTPNSPRSADVIPN